MTTEQGIDVIYMAISQSCYARAIGEIRIFWYSSWLASDYWTSLEKARTASQFAKGVRRLIGRWLARDGRWAL